MYAQYRVNLFIVGFACVMLLLAQSMGVSQGATEEGKTGVDNEGN